MGKYSQFDRFKSTEETFRKKGNREWAKAKNDDGGEHYAFAKDAYDRAKRNGEKAYREMEKIILNEDE